MRRFNRLSLRAKIVSVGLALTVVVVAVLFLIYGIQAKKKTVTAFQKKADAINLTAESVRKEMDKRWAQGVFSQEEVKTWAQTGQMDKILAIVPVVMAWQSAMEGAKESGYTFKVPKFDPRNPENTPDEVEGPILRKMKAEGLNKYTMIDQDLNAIRTFRAVRLSETCMMCHGQPSMSEKYWGNEKGLDPFGVKMEGWEVGSMHGAFEIIQSLDAADRELRNSLLAGGAVVLIGLAASGILFVLVITFAVNRPVQRVTRDLESSSDEVAGASGEISRSSQSLADGASSQAASLEQTSASLEELASMTRTNADNAKQADQLMDETRKVVSRAGNSMNQMNRSMDEISASGQEIGKIIKTIDEIAFQTNLLALNAAVEAARAGEAGQGFAVVADEVRNLAGRAAEAARSTAQLIEETINKIGEGTQFVREAHQAFEEVNQAAEKVGGLVSDVASASSEQAQGIDQINQAMNQMDQVIQNNAAQAEESAASAEELGAQAETLRGIVSDLESVVRGSKDNGPEDRD